MATITGIKLTQLSVLSLGSTGTRFYAVSAGGSSFQIYEKDLFNTLNVLHISGAYQPKFEDWRFVHKSGTESITGNKIFANTLSVDTISAKSTTNQINVNGKVLGRIGGIPVVDWGNYIIFDGSSNYSIDWGNRDLTNTSSISTLNWQNKDLIGNWTKNSGYILTSIDSGNMVGVAVEATGIALHNQIVGLSGSLVSTGSNLIGYLRNFSGNFQSFTTPITPLGSGSYRVNYPLGPFPSSPRVYCSVEVSGDIMYTVNITGRNPTGFWALFSNTVNQNNVVLHTFASLNS